MLLMYFPNHILSCCIEPMFVIFPCMLLFFSLVFGPFKRLWNVLCSFLGYHGVVQQNAHLHSSALNVFQVVFVVSSRELSNSVNKLMIHWYDVLFSILNWTESLQLICYVLPLLRNCNEERDLCLLCSFQAVFVREGKLYFSNVNLARNRPELPSFLCS